VVWLLEELEIDYRLQSAPLTSPLPRPYAQDAPHGKIPALVDGEVSMFESGAIVEHLIERYGDGRLAPAPGTPLRPEYLQWLHFGEATLFPGIGNIAWHVHFRDNANTIPDAMCDYRAWAMGGFDTLERRLSDRSYLLGDDFTAADIMVGYTLFVAKGFDVLSDTWPSTCDYLARLNMRPAMKKALSV
jgi:glutathione S-transferase